MEQLNNFSSYRSPILVQNECVSSNQPLATKAGLEILQLGGNAADAAVATAAALAVTEPTSTGIGGDAFCIFYNGQTKEVGGLNGSGHSPAALSLELLESEGFTAENPPPNTHAHNVTVPGSVAAWIDTIQNFGSGKLTIAEILAPAISLAENGFPVNPISHNIWKTGEALLNSRRNGQELLLNGKAPRAAEIMKLPYMANTLKAIVEEVLYYGGVLSLEDLAQHTSTLVTPISTEYKGNTIWEIPPNGLGIASAEYQHLLIEALKLSFADSIYFVSDPDQMSVPTMQLLDKNYAAQRRELISTDMANNFPVHGNPEIKRASDTVYLTAVDKEGNACSFINSNYMTFGTGIVPLECGFALHNRGALFSLDPTQPNVIAPNKRPQHTIIPAMVTDVSGNLLATFGIMGGFMQPQAQIQVLLGMIEFGLDPQQALNLPRFYIDIGPSQPWTVKLEKEVPEEVKTALEQKGHVLEWPIGGYGRRIFGRGHVITRGGWFIQGGDDDFYNGPDVWWAAADPRCDGYPQGY
ncbi:putative gamma-glutamyltransferase YwrD [Blattella germanica]|nr:putative gamma-glutamyltransferase YwrD [Blattella germanica]